MKSKSPGIMMLMGWLTMTAITVITAMTPSSLVAAELRPVDVWQQAETLFAAAGAAEAGSDASVAQYSDAALKFTYLAQQAYRPGAAWVNAGNAWFEAGELGRAIAAYRHAEIYLPFDTKVQDSLQSARALRLDVLSVEEWQPLSHFPMRWVKAIFLLLLVLLSAAVLLHIRFRQRWSLVLLGALVVLQFAGLWLVLVTSANQGKAGVLIAEEITARKGPGYQYQPAFNQPLHNGLEFNLMETRDEWCLISLPDGRECWIPERIVTLIEIDP